MVKKRCKWCGRPHDMRGDYCTPRCSRWSKQCPPPAKHLEGYDDEVLKMFWELMHGEYFGGQRIRRPCDYAATCLYLACRLVGYPYILHDIEKIGKISKKYINKFKESVVLSPINYRNLVKKLCEINGFNDVLWFIDWFFDHHEIHGSPSIPSIAAALTILAYEQKKIHIPKREVAGIFKVSDLTVRKQVSYLRRLIQYSSCSINSRIIS